MTSKLLSHRKILWNYHEINLNLHHDGDGKFLKPNNPYTKLHTIRLPVMNYAGLHYKPQQSKTSAFLNFKSNYVIN